MGSKIGDILIGSGELSDITVFSFHPVKMITTGEGGILLTDDIEIEKNTKLARSHGITREKINCPKKKNPNWYYEQIDIGFNLDLQSFKQH